MTQRNSNVLSVLELTVAARYGMAWHGTVGENEGHIRNHPDRFSDLLKM